MRRHLLPALLLYAPMSVQAASSTNDIVMPPARLDMMFMPASGGAQRLSHDASLPDRYWRLFGSAKLDALVDQGLAHNNDLANSEASLHQAQELAKAAGGAQGPQIDANYQVQRVRVSNDITTPLADPTANLYTLHTGQLNVSYPIDLFGGGRSRVASARAGTEVAADRLQAARSTVVANLVVAVIQYATLDAEIVATNQTIENDRDILSLLERRRALGDIGLADVSAQQTVLAAAEATLPPLERQRAHALGQITVLTGQAPGTSASNLPAIDEFVLPQDLPLSLPAEIVAHRSDVRAADAQVRGAAADAHTALAARLPSLLLTGSAGGSATRFAEMFASPNLFFSLIGGITQPLFHSGQLRHQQRAAEAALDGTKAQYRAAILQAFLDLDDALSALRTDAAALDSAERADSAAEQTLTMNQRQLELGAIGTLGLLNASAAAAQTHVQRIQARSARLADTVALFQASGAPIPEN